MDTAAAAAAAVAVDLKPDHQLLGSSTKSRIVGGGRGASGTGCDCLGSTVETMSVTPPPTPPSRACDVHVEPGVPSAHAEAHSKNGLKGKEAPEIATAVTEPAQPDLPATSSTSSAIASKTPTSALPGSGSGLGLGSVAAATEHPSAAAPPVPSNGSNSSSSSSSVPGSGENVVQLLPWQDMPTYLQFNPYVLRGYRPLQTFKGCLLSLFYWHNETINILTHAIPIFYILAIVPGLMPWDSGYKFLSFCHVFGSVAPWCGSFVYHLFMNIEKGENVYYTLLKLDMVGIWVSQSFGALPLVTATTLCFPPVLKWLIIISYCVLSLWGLYKALTASSPWQRRLCFALPFGMRSILTFLRIRGMVGGSHMALSHVYLQDGVSILGGAIGAMRIPEKWFPGVVDFYLNSHNIMHVLVVVAVYSMHKATIKDFEWMSTQTCHTAANATEQALGHVEL
ncbi:progestin and adipoQ receptor family member 4 isoform X2 [Drosophila rhopaloa]|uniref:Progestin and adipoQ receptor family member 4 isoform X2 n=1 Tax=Drosophila rhopaloa TaxID=1041015 RepID=A0A6P4FDW6_DRORH|nr:progestin and adipoQ receptor family member 4 isoform X2 [Drosophila rhopaloa]